MTTHPISVNITYAGMPKKSELSEKPPELPAGEIAHEVVEFDDYNLTISAPTAAADRMKRWISHKVATGHDYRLLMKPMLTSSKGPLQFTLIGEELWNITVSNV